MEKYVTGGGYAKKAIRSALLYLIKLTLILGLLLGGLFINTFANEDSPIVFSGGFSDSVQTYTVTKTGTYSVHIKGGGTRNNKTPISTTQTLSIPGGSYTGITGTSGDLTAIFDFQQGDILSVISYAGGAGGGYAGDGGDALLMLKNGTPIIGAGGGAGLSLYRKETSKSSNTTIQYYHYNTTNTLSVSVINNSLFSSGGGGQQCGWNVDRGSLKADGENGRTYPSCTPAKGAEGLNELHTRSWDFPTAGENYLDSSGTLVSMPNGSDSCAFSVAYMENYELDNSGDYGFLQYIDYLDDKVISNGFFSSFDVNNPWEVTIPKSGYYRITYTINGSVGANTGYIYKDSALIGRVLGGSQSSTFANTPTANIIAYAEKGSKISFDFSGHGGKVGFSIETFTSGGGNTHELEQKITAIEGNISELKDNNCYTVTENCEFSFVVNLPLPESTVNITGGSVTFTKDGEVSRITGSIRSRGIYKVEIGSIKMFFNVIEQPTSTNVSVVLN